MNCLHKPKNHTVYEQFLTTLMTNDNNNLEDENENVNKKVDGDSNKIQQK